MARRDLAAARQRPAEIGGLAGLPAHPVVEHRIARPGVESQDLGRALADPGDIADPAEVEHRERLRQRRGQRGVIERRQRRAFAAGGDVGAAEIGDHIATGQPRQQRPVADLPGPALRRLMHDRVAVKSDQIDRVRP